LAIFAAVPHSSIGARIVHIRLMHANGEFSSFAPPLEIAFDDGVAHRRRRGQRRFPNGGRPEGPCKP